MWHMTPDTLTPDTWQVTLDMFWGVNIVSKVQLPLTLCDFWYYEDLEEKADWLTDWLVINYKAVYRTAPATQGLLKKPLG